MEKIKIDYAIENADNGFVATSRELGYDEAKMVVLSEEEEKFWGREISGLVKRIANITLQNRLRMSIVVSGDDETVGGEA